VLRLIRSIDIPKNSRVPFWQEEVCPYLYRVDSIGVSKEDFSFVWETRDIGAFGFAHMTADIRGRRRSRTAISRDGFDAIALQRSDCGPITVEFARQTIRLEENDWIALSLNWPHEMHAAKSISLRSLELPRTLLSPFLLGGILQRPMHISARSPVGAVASATLDAVWMQLPKLNASLGENVLRSLLSLIGVVCRTGAGEHEIGQGGVSAARFQTVLRHLQQHVADPDLSPASTARALGISVRYLHKLFEPTGESFAGYVVRERLAGCRASLENPLERDRSTTDIAFGWGFGSLPTFYRAFSREFGCAPGDLRSRRALDETTTVRCLRGGSGFSVSY
jgi:AraC-like DNA-binding protein